jgi:energy-coupling factor transporter ATP-binding protein EcfA2
MALNWRLALAALAVIPGVMVISFIFARRIRPIYRSTRKDAEEIDGRVGEAFSGIRVVRAFRREIRELLDYMRGRHTVLRKELFAQRRELVIWTSWNLLMGIVNVAIVWYGGFLNLRGGASIGDIMAFQWYTFLLLNPVWNIVNSFSELQRSLAAMERVFEVLAMDGDKPDRPGARDAPRVVDEIRFDNVEFEYRESQPVIRDFNVVVPGGSVVALVGRSGAGKTTVTDLVARFHDPTKGRILLNGTDIRDYRLRTHRAACWPWSSKTSSCSMDRCGTTSPTAATMHPTPRSKTPHGAPMRMSSSSSFRNSTRRSSGSAASSSQEASNNVWPLPGRSSRLPRSSSSTRPRATSTPRASNSFRRRWPRYSLDEPPSSSRIASPPCAAPA